jgi:membrane protease subunit HflK
MRKALLLFLVAVAGYALTGVVSVRPGERAVVRRFGRVLPETPEPGLWVGLPWGMDRVDRVVVDQVRQVVVGYRDEEDENAALPAGQMLTGDHNLVNVQVVLFYTVDPEGVAEFVIQQPRVEALLARAVEARAAEWVAGQDVDAVLLRGKVDLREDLLERLPGRLQAQRLGVVVRDVRVGLIAPPDLVKEAFDRVARAQTEMKTEEDKALAAADTKLKSAAVEVEGIRKAGRTDAEKLRSDARTLAENYGKSLAAYRRGRRTNPDYLNLVWAREVLELLLKLKATDGLDLFSGKGIELMPRSELPRRMEERPKGGGP